MTVDRDPNSENVSINLRFKLKDQQMWDDFNAIGNEMIITKNGRCLFPLLRFSVEFAHSEASYLDEERLLANNNLQTEKILCANRETQLLNEIAELKETVRDLKHHRHHHESRIEIDNSRQIQNISDNVSVLSNLVNGLLRSQATLQPVIK